MGQGLGIRGWGLGDEERAATAKAYQTNRRCFRASLTGDPQFPQHDGFGLRLCRAAFAFPIALSTAISGTFIARISVAFTCVLPLIVRKYRSISAELNSAAMP